MRTPAVSGHEGALAKQIEGALKEYSPKMDNLGNVVITVGSDAPHRLIVTPMDQPGYVVSEVTDDGFLRGAEAATSGTKCCVRLAEFRAASLGDNER